MRIDEIIAARRPTFSVEFFPPKTAEATEQLLRDRARRCGQLEPDFVSVTYGAGGSTRDGTVEITTALKDELGFETMAHLSCVGETTEGLAATLDRIEAAGIENVFALRGDPPRGRGGLRPARGRPRQRRRAGRLHRRRLGLRDRRRLLPRGPPRGARPRDRPRLPEDQGRRRRRLPDHPALLRQPGLLRLRRGRRGRAGIEVPILAGVIPVASFAQTKRICDLCDASIPAPLEAAFEAAGGDPERRVRARRRLRRPAVRGAADRRRARASTSTRSTRRRRRGRCSARCGRRGRGSGSAATPATWPASAD